MQAIVKLILLGDTIKHEKKQNTRKIKYFSSNSSPYGITYGAWTVKWWKWWFSIKRDRNPAMDKTGIYASQKQSMPTWFLAGTWVSEHRKYPHRRCSVPSGVSILFPVINCEENPLEYPDLRTENDMKSRLLRDMGTVNKSECFVNGEEVPPQLVESDPEFFRIRIRKDMAENGKGGETTMTTSGYWVFLKPLREGRYNISFEGSYQYGKLHAGATYDIVAKD